MGWPGSRSKIHAMLLEYNYTLSRLQFRLGWSVGPLRSLPLGMHEMHKIGEDLMFEPCSRACRRASTRGKRVPKSEPVSLPVMFSRNGLGSSHILRSCGGPMYILAQITDIQSASDTLGADPTFYSVRADDLLSPLSAGTLAGGFRFGVQDSNPGNGADNSKPLGL